VIEVHRRARVHADRAGEPLDGLVNMFDVGIVLAVAFLLAALQALNLTNVLTHKTVGSKGQTLVIKPNEKLVPIKPGSKQVHVKAAQSVGQVYQLPDGRLVLVRKK
jgi:hypothetical protein